MFKRLNAKQETHTRIRPLAALALALALCIQLAVPAFGAAFYEDDGPPEPPVSEVAGEAPAEEPAEDENVSTETDLAPASGVVPDKSWYSDEETSFVLTDEADLFGFADLMNDGKEFSGKTVMLGANITLTQPWVPAGFINRGNVNGTTFFGTFDGDGYTVSGLVINDTKILEALGYTSFVASSNDYGKYNSAQYISFGLISQLAYHATVKNLTLSVKEYSLTEGEYAYAGVVTGGPVKGNPTGVSIQNCHVVAEGGAKMTLGDSTYWPTHIGGLAGSLYPSSSSDPSPVGVENCSADIDIVVSRATAASTHRGGGTIGGLIGYAEECWVKNSRASGSVTLENPAGLEDSRTVGGLAGGGSYLENCYATGDVTVTAAHDVNNINYKVGGLVGSSHHKYGHAIINCHATGNVSGGGHTGGLVGSFNISMTDTTAEITGCSSTGNVTGDLIETSNGATGGLIGELSNSPISVSSSFSTGNVTGTRRVGGLIGSSTAGASFVDCYAIGDVTGSVITSYTQVGGFVGRDYSSTPHSYTNCSYTGAVSAIGCNTGGFAGENYGDLINCHTKADITVSGDADAVGGLVGSQQPTVIKVNGEKTDVLAKLRNSSWEGSITLDIGSSSGPNLGGAIGTIDGDPLADISLSNISVNGTLAQTNEDKFWLFGGMVGSTEVNNTEQYGGGSLVITDSVTVLENSIDFPASVSNAYGALLGRFQLGGASSLTDSDTPIFTNVYGRNITNEVLGRYDVGYECSISDGFKANTVAGAHLGNEAYLKTPGTYTGLDFTNTWDMVTVYTDPPHNTDIDYANSSYPFLRHSGDIATSNITAVAESAAIQVVPGTPFGGLPLPATATVTAGSLKPLVVKWEPGTYDPSSEGTYTLQGELFLPSNVTNSGTMKATVKVIVKEDSNPRLEMQSGGVAYAGGSLIMGKTLQLGAVLKNLGAVSPSITWNSSKTDVATVSSGLVTAIAAGETTITATASHGGKTYTASCSLIVTWDDDGFTIRDLADGPVKLTETSGDTIITGTYSDPDLNYLVAAIEIDTGFTGTVKLRDITISLPDIDNDYYKAYVALTTWARGDNPSFNLILEGENKISQSRPGKNFIDHCVYLSKVNMSGPGSLTVDCTMTLNKGGMSFDEYCVINTTITSNGIDFYGHGNEVKGGKVTALVEGITISGNSSVGSTSASTTFSGGEVFATGRSRGLLVADAVLNVNTPVTVVQDDLEYGNQGMRILRGVVNVNSEMSVTSNLDAVSLETDSNGDNGTLNVGANGTLTLQGGKRILGGYGRAGAGLTISGVLRVDGKLVATGGAGVIGGAGIQVVRGTGENPAKITVGPTGKIIATGGATQQGAAPGLAVHVEFDGENISDTSGVELKKENGGSVLAYPGAGSNPNYNCLYMTGYANVETGDYGKYARLTGFADQDTGGPALPTITIQRDGSDYAGGQMTLAQKTLQLSYKAENGTAGEIKWTSSKTNVATVSSSGLVTAKAVGETTITLEATVDGTTVSDTAVIKVVETVTELTKVTVSPSSVKFALGTSRTLRATPNTGATLEGATIAWSVTASNPTNPGDPAVVAFEGAANAASTTLKATAAGTATVQVTVTPAGGAPLTATCTVEVYTAVTGLSLSESTLRMLPAAAGSPAPTATLAATVTPASAETDLVWRSSNSRVVAVAAGADGKTANLTAGAAGSAVVSVSTADGAFTASCAVTVGWAEGTLALDKGYLLLATTDSPVTLNIAATSADATFPLGTPTDLTGANTAADVAVSPTGDTLTITPKAAGTVYVRIGVPGNPGLTAACKVVVYTPGGDLARRRIDPATLTIYRLQEAPDLRIPLVLEDGGTPWKLTDATYAFAGTSAEVLGAAFDILPHEDGQSLMLVKKAGFAALTAAKYTATITVTPTGKEASAELIPDTLTIKLAGGLPKLAVNAITLESFGENRTADIVLTGVDDLSYTLDENPAKESANRKTREWLTLDKTAQTITIAAGTPKKSGTYHLTATLAGWGANAKVNISLKVNSTCTMPQLALDKTSVTVFETAAKTTGAPLRLMPKTADATLAGLGVEGLEVVGTLSATEAKTYKNQAAFKVTGFNKSTGSFTLEATGGNYPAGKVLLGAKVAGSSWLVRVPVTVKVLKPGGTVKLAANATSVTLNQLLTPRQAFTFVLDTNVPGYSVDWDNLPYTLTRGKTDVKGTDELDLNWDGSALTVGTTGATTANASYKLKITKTGLYLDKKGNPKDGSITLTIKTVKTTAQVSAKLSVSGKSDLTTGACAVVTAKLANYQGGYTAQPTFAVTPPKGAPTAMKDAFDFEPVGGDGTGWRIMPKPGVDVMPGSYKVSITGGTGTLPGVASTPATTATKFTVAASKPKVTQSATKVTLYTADKASTASLSLSLPAGTAPVKKVEMKGYDASLYDFELTGRTLTISFKQANFDAKKVKSKTLTFEVYLEGNAKPANTFKVGVTAKAFK
ncbi:Ig-like domain-containing protein [Ruminococcaceae bacterium OttesenSCG-928-D13]|nr:Ig-like domain-containing protein [Ruminococcaceae bacterium OttesenSCG-928-D13]